MEDADDRRALRHCHACTSSCNELHVTYEVDGP
jgi:hypothetical protein